jgi:hypothetical protein
VHERGAVAVPFLLFAVLLAAAIVLFLEAGHLSANHDSGTGTEGTIPHGQWVAAIDQSGQVIVLDRRTGGVEARISQRVADPADAGIALTAKHTVAYVASGGEIVLVRLVSGEESHVAEGDHPALSPGDEWLGFTQRGAVVVQNVATGEDEVFRAPRGDHRFDDVVDVAWSTTGRQLLVLTPTALFSLNHERAHSLADARVVADAGGSRWTSVAPLAGRLFVAEAGSGVSEIADDGGARTALDVTATGLTSDSDHRLVTYVDGDGTLWRWDGHGAPRRLAPGIAAAAP